MSKQCVLATKSRAVHTQAQATGTYSKGRNHVQYTHTDRATGTYSRGEITCSTDPGASEKERKAGAKSRAVHTQGQVTGA